MILLDWLSMGIDTYFACKRQTKPHANVIDKTRLIAHRGAHNHKQSCLENTDSAFAKALAFGCWGIEFDIRATADQKLIVNHDPTLKRLWNKNLTINTLTLSQLRQEAPLVPTLTEVIGKYGKKMHLFIEIKAPFSDVEPLIEALKPLTPIQDYHLLALDESLFTLIEHAFPKESLLLVPLHNNVGHFCNLSVQKGYGGVLAHYLLLRQSQITNLRNAHQKVGVGFIDSKNGLYRELNRGIEWIFSNNVEQVSAYLQELRLLAST
ncbi:glycerophosphoryl diester phosphodiesterase [Legionella busanensis]|uniref:Glycerophosphoryl diester phosphodiesterase n=1 Tax=Legionella busanensis TaxID=190655 RepID=A0A378JI92_9GAMM|nr:glycerophosphodiester phosphodiesterase family protein [Legionella busanensis]STX49970.1 glycerophosphoryl diester phosphodiesterase [Legionella busanensis]